MVYLQLRLLDRAEHWPAQGSLDYDGVGVAPLSHGARHVLVVTTEVSPPTNTTKPKSKRY